MKSSLDPNNILEPIPENRVFYNTCTITWKGYCVFAIFSVKDELVYISSLKEKLPTPFTTTFTIPLASHSIGVVEPGE